MMSPVVIPKAALVPISGFTTSSRMKSSSAALPACGSLNMSTSKRLGSSTFRRAKSTALGKGPLGSMPR